MTTTTVQTHTSSLARDLVMLTKPRIISLLLVTTVAPMFVAGVDLRIHIAEHVRF